MALAASVVLLPGSLLAEVRFASPFMSHMVSNALALTADSVTTMEISSGPVTHDIAHVLGALAYGGTLVVTNVGGSPFAAGDSFQLFDSSTPSGSFSSVTLPPLGTNLVWVTSGLAVNGTIVVLSTAPPVFNSVVLLGGGGFRLTFTGPTGLDFAGRVN